MSERTLGTTKVVGGEVRESVVTTCWADISHYMLVSYFSSYFFLRHFSGFLRYSVVNRVYFISLIPFLFSVTCRDLLNRYAEGYARSTTVSCKPTSRKDLHYAARGINCSYTTGSRLRLKSFLSAQRHYICKSCLGGLYSVLIY